MSCPPGRLPVLFAVILLAAAPGCGHGLGPVGPGTTGLRGTVTFSGTWPADTGLVVVALFPYKPTDTDIVYPVVWQTVTESGISSFDYVLQPPAGSYGYLVVAWQRQGDSIFDLSSWVELGYHPDSSDPGIPGTVLVTPGVFGDIDLAADLSLVPPPVFAR